MISKDSLANFLLVLIPMFFWISLSVPDYFLPLNVMACYYAGRIVWLKLSLFYKWLGSVTISSILFVKFFYGYDFSNGKFLLWFNLRAGYSSNSFVLNILFSSLISKDLFSVSICPDWMMLLEGRVMNKFLLFWTWSSGILYRWF